MLLISDGEKNAFNLPDLEVVQSIADQFAVGIQNTRLFNEMQSRARMLSALSDASLLVNSTMDINQLSERVYNTFEQMQTADIFQFVIYDEYKESLRVETYWDGRHRVERMPYDPDDNLISQIIEYTTPIFWRNPAEREIVGQHFHVEQADSASFLGLPMVSKRSAMGVLCVYADSPYMFSDSTMKVLFTFASSVAVALDNAESLQYTTRRVQELAAINEISNVLGRTLLGDDSWRIIQRHIVSLFEESAFFIALWDENRDTLTYPVASDESMEWQEQPPAAVRSLSQSLLRNGHTLLLADLSQEGEQLAKLESTAAQADFEGLVRSWLSVPLQTSNGEVIGVMGIYSDTPERYEEYHQSVFLTIAAQISLSLENTRLFEREQERRRVADTLIDVGRTVASSLQTDKVLDRILEQMRRVVEYDNGTIMLRRNGESNPGDLIIYAAAGQDHIPVNVSISFAEDSLMMEVYRTKRPVIVGDVQNHKQWNSFQELAGEGAQFIVNLDTRGWLGVPMIVGERVIGYIFLDKYEPDYYVQRDADTVFALAQQAAIAVENARLFEAEQQRRQMADTLMDVGRTVASSLERDKVMDRLLEQIGRVVEYDGASVMLQAPHVDDASEVIITAYRGNIMRLPRHAYLFLRKQLEHAGVPAG